MKKKVRFYTTLYQYLGLNFFWFLYIFNIYFHVSCGNLLKILTKLHKNKWMDLKGKLIYTSYNFVWCNLNVTLRLSGKEYCCQAGDRDLIPQLEDFLEKEIATHSSILAWEIPWREESGGLLSMGLQRVRYDLVTNQQQQQTLQKYY